MTKEYEARGLTPDAARLAEAHHVRRDAQTYEISWPPCTMGAILRTLKLIDREVDHDT